MSLRSCRSFLRRFPGLVLCLVLCFSLIPAASLAADAGYYVNNPNPAERLHLRTGKSEAYTSLGKYYNGTPVTLLEDCGEWFRVRIGGELGSLEGYMLRKYLTAGSVTSAMPEYVSVAASWRIYDYPADLLTDRMLGYGEEILLMGFTDSWYHITTRDGRLTGFVPAGANCLVPPFTALVNNTNPADRLNLRVRPDKSAASLGKYYSGVTVTIYGLYVDNQWARVRIGSQEGYMDAKYLALDESMKKVKSAIPTQTVDLPEGQQLHLRKAPNADALSLGRYPAGTKVSALGVAGDWVHVLVNGSNEEGFMLAEHLSPKLRE